MNVVSIKIEGARELDRKLRRLAAIDRTAARRVIRQSLRAGAKIIHQKAKSLIPMVGNKQHPPGTLKKSLAVRAMKRSRRGVIGVKVETREGNFKGYAFYAPMVEFGHKLGKRELGDQRQQVEGKHYIERAANDEKERVGITVVEMMRSGIIREAKRA